MTEGPMVAVRGEAVREVPPEIAHLTVTVTARDADRGKVLARLSERSEAVRAVIDGYGAAIERRETGNLYVTPEYRRRGERVSAYHGSVRTDLVVTDFTVLGELAVRLAETDQSTVTGPWWELRPDSPVYREVRLAAIADAVARATDYAEAVGARLAVLREIADVGLSAGPAERMFGYPAPAGGAMIAAGGAPVLELDPQPQRIHGQVEMRFGITDPDPGRYGAAAAGS